MTMINGGFFWGQKNGAIQVDAEDVVLTNSVFYGRPRWWQLVRWYRAIRLWVSLPHD